MIQRTNKNQGSQKDGGEKEEDGSQTPLSKDASTRQEDLGEHTKIDQNMEHQEEDSQEKKVCTVVRTFSGHGSEKGGLRHFLTTWMGQQVRFNLHLQERS
tara:strand:- start:1000 stop:1299 length:300 start_codon:yes stop_codon:yes gene_type:complete